MKKNKSLKVHRYSTSATQEVHRRRDRHRRVHCLCLQFSSRSAIHTHDLWNWTYLSWRSICAFLTTRSALPSTTNPLINHTLIHHTLGTVKKAFHTVSCTVSYTETQAATRAGSYLCQHPRCSTCGHISSETELLGPNDCIPIKESFTCLSSGLIYSISCRRCPAIYIGETGCAARERFGEHLRSITKSAPGFPVAEPFSRNGHTEADALVRGPSSVIGINK